MIDQPASTCRIDLLTKLEAALAWQLSLVHAGDWSRLAEDGDKVKDLLAQVGGQDACVCDRCAEQIRRIRDTHRRLGLTLASRRQAEGINIRRIGQGKKLLKTYGGDS